MKMLLALALIAGTTLTHAATREEKIQSLMEAQGLLTIFEQQILEEREANHHQADIMLSQVMNELAPTDEFKTKIHAATDDFIKDLQGPWTAKDIVAQWSKLYGAKFTDPELDQLLAFYSSPLAQREVVAGREAMNQLTVRYQAQYKPIKDKATRTFIDRIQALVAECHCRKKA